MLAKAGISNSTRYSKFGHLSFPKDLYLPINIRLLLREDEHPDDKVTNPPRLDHYLVSDASNSS